MMSLIRGIPCKKPPPCCWVLRNKGGLFARSANLSFFNEGKIKDLRMLRNKGGFLLRGGGFLLGIPLIRRELNFMELF